MDPIVFWVVLGAAVMHATWNAVVKVGLDRFSLMLLLSLVQSGLALALLALFPLPAAASWGWLAASAVLHAGYKIFLIQAYEHGDLGQVYPLARGTAPLIVALVSMAVLGEVMGATKTAAVVAIGLGVIVMSMRSGPDMLALPRLALTWALGTACFTAAYTLVDGAGSRLSGSASGFTMFIFIGDGVCMALYALAARGRSAFRGLLPAWRSGVLAGALSLGSYWIAIWAFTQAPIAMVAALRETSVLFAMLISVIVLREATGPWRWLAAALIGAGVVGMRM